MGSANQQHSLPFPAKPFHIIQIVPAITHRSMIPEDALFTWRKGTTNKWPIYTAIFSSNHPLQWLPQFTFFFYMSRGNTTRHSPSHSNQGPHKKSSQFISPYAPFEKGLGIFSQENCAPSLSSFTCGSSCWRDRCSSQGCRLNLTHFGDGFCRHRQMDFSTLTVISNQLCSKNLVQRSTAAPLWWRHHQRT